MKNYDEERLKEEYMTKPKTGLDEARKLDQKCKLPAYIFAYTFGILGALILGVGMCLAMEVIATGPVMVALGVIIGIIGIIMVSINYPIYNKILKARKEKYASSIILALNKKD